MKVIPYKKGASVIIQNSPNKGYFYIVRKGTLVVDSEHKLSDKHLSYFNEGDSFGLVSALTGHNFLVTIYAHTNAELLEIPISELGKFLKKNRPIALRIMSLYVRELKALQSHLAKANPPSERVLGIEGLLRHTHTYLSMDKPAMASHAVYIVDNYLTKNPDYPNISYLQQEIQDLKTKISTEYRPFSWNKKMKTIPEETILFLENEPGDSLFVISKGRVRLSSIIRGQEYIIDVLNEGEIFGEMSMLDKSVRMASAVTETESTVLNLRAEDLVDELGAAVLQKIFESLARRIWFSHQRLIILKIQNPVTRLYALLYNMIRDRAIKKNISEAETYAMQQTLSTNFDDLKVMCGILKIKDESIRAFREDHNIVIEDQEICVLSRKRLEEKLVFFKTRAGHIAADLV